MIAMIAGIAKAVDAISDAIINPGNLGNSGNQQ